MRLGAKLTLLKAMHCAVYIDTHDLEVGSEVEFDCLTSASLSSICLIVAKLLFLYGLYTKSPYFHKVAIIARPHKLASKILQEHRLGDHHSISKISA